MSTTSNAIIEIQKGKGRQETCRPFPNPTDKKKRRKKARSPLRFFRLHPLFLIVGIWYACTGELFLFLMSALVALQHECAHAFAAAKLGYKLNAIVLMPFGAVIDGDLRGISLKDEIYVALCGPLCNLITALFFVAVWWLQPSLYAFTDTACFTSLSIALVNLLPAYPLDGGRILKCALTRLFLRTEVEQGKAEKRAEWICRIIALLTASAFLLAFFLLLNGGEWNITLAIFGVFLFVGSFGNRRKEAVYSRMEFPCLRAMERGVEIRRVAVLSRCRLKDALRFLTRGAYLVLEVYDERENHLFDLTQNELSALLSIAETPYQSLGELCGEKIVS